MIPKHIRDIAPGDLQALVDDEVREGKTIEYKLELPGNADSQKAKFLASVSSFANTAGGDHIFGVEAKGGLPKGLPGVATGDPDADVLRLEHILASGLEPRLPRVDIQPVQVAEGQHVFVLRVPKSWVSPHRVRQNGRFYGRNSAGKYELDVGQLRTAFTLSETVADRIRSFRTDRVAKVYGGETPVPLKKGGVLVLHLLPLSAFVEHKQIDLSVFENPDGMIMPMGGCRGLGWHVNLDGFVTFEDAVEHVSGKYTQVFRSGAVEATEVLGPREQDMELPGSVFELHSIQLFVRFRNLAPALGIDPPVYAFLSMVGVRGYQLGIHGGVVYEHPYPLSQDMVLLPEVVMEDFGVDPARLLRPAFDMVWNAFGLLRSLNFDDQGNWRAHR